jgi:Glycosyltransferase GT-D fold
MNYPDVVGEWETLLQVLDGKSIARYGDGEFNLVRGGNCVSQRKVPGIQTELQNILKGKNKDLLVAIPRLDKRSPKNVNWVKCCSHYGGYLQHGKTYYSAFITRPDSAPWIATPTYFDGIEKLWEGKDITMVYGSNRSLSVDFPAMKSAKSITVVETDYAHTYPKIDAIERQIHRAGNKTVLLMCGPTATCLAARLAGKFHAIDLGHIGMWWRAYENPKLVSQLKLAQ